MELNEFVRLDADKVRRDKELMQLFVKFYEAAFSFIPNCVGCSFKSGFKKLKQYALSDKKNVNFDKTSTMKTFVIKKEYQLKVASFLKNGKMHRSYSHNMTEEFAQELVKAGKGYLFSKLPQQNYNDLIPKSIEDTKVTVSFGKDGEIKKVEPYKVTDYETMDYRTEILPLYAEVKERTGETAEGRKKEDIINFLKIWQ